MYNASFNYPGQPALFKNVDFGIDMDSRIAIVGKNVHMEKYALSLFWVLEVAVQLAVVHMWGSFSPCIPDAVPTIISCRSAFMYSTVDLH